MKKKPKAKLSAFEHKLVVEFLTDQPTRIGSGKSENKGFSDMPLFAEKDRQTKVF